QQRLESVVQGFRELRARTLLGERKIGREPAQLRRSTLQFDRSLAQRRGCASPFSHVRHEGNGVPAGTRADVIQADFDRKDRSILPFTDEIAVAAHWTGMRGGEVAGPMAGMCVTEPLLGAPLARLATPFPHTPATPPSSH